MAPGPLPKPPGRPPAEPIIIRTPPRPREDLEIDGSDDEMRMVVRSGDRRVGSRTCGRHHGPRNGRRGRSRDQPSRSGVGTLVQLTAAQ